jgi:CRP-like cAMP-binding protein
MHTRNTHIPTPFPSIDAIDALSRIDLLRWCNREQLELVRPDTDVLDLPAGTVLERAGTHGHQFIGLVRGTVEHDHVTAGVTLMHAGDQIGAAELIDGSAHEATCTALTDITVVVVFGPAFRSLVGSLVDVPCSDRVLAAAA